jgi:beta-glucosidase/6-phospho-beta-glucosidase/beta-galactosidase
VSHDRPSHYRGWVSLLLGMCWACSDDPSASSEDAVTTSTISSDSFGKPGPLVGDKGRNAFRFGAASAATQIEDQNKNTDWYVWTQPKPEGLGNGEFVGEAAHGYSRALEDVELLAELGVDAYRFSMEWARIEPEQGKIDQGALDHYSELLDALQARGIRPLVTLHHYSNPLWVSDPRDAACSDGPSARNLCGWDHPTGGPQIVEAFGRFARLLAERFGDRVDEWGTINEPLGYLSAAYGLGTYPPGQPGFLIDVDAIFFGALRNFAAAHAAAYHAIHEADTRDANDDGVAAAVGVTMASAEMVPSRAGALSEEAADVQARDRLDYTFHFLFTDAVTRGGFDSDLDGELDETHDDWRDTLDFLGVQYYTRMGVTGSPGLLPKVMATPCDAEDLASACVAPLDPSFLVPTMKYEHWPEGLYHRLAAYGGRYPGLPLVVTESGIATTLGTRRSEAIVRALEQVKRAQQAGIDVRGYYHWSLLDNFEWMNGYAPRFGLFSVDYGSQARTATSAVDLYKTIVHDRAISKAQHARFGGDGPLTPEP